LKTDTLLGEEYENKIYLGGVDWMKRAQDRVRSGKFYSDWMFDGSYESISNRGSKRCGGQ
jgi:hypothetical protein